MPRRRKGLGDVHQRKTFFACCKGCGHPFDNNICAAASDHLRRGNIGAAGQDGDVQVFIGVIAVFKRHIIARELALRDPFQLKRDVICRRCRACAYGKGQLRRSLI